jgi:hypothetical protein
VTTRLGRIGLALVAAVLLAGCGGTVSGRGETAPAATPSETAALDPGGYPTTARAPLGVAGSEDAGRVAEGRRMAGHVVGPWQVDPRLTSPGPTGAVVLERRDQIGLVVWAAMLTRFPLAPFIVGFTCDRKAADPNDPTSLRTAVLRYPDAGSADAAAQGLADGALAMPVVAETAQPVPAAPLQAIPVPGHAEATGVLFSRPQGASVIQDLTVFSAHGPYVFIQVVSGAPAEVAAALAGRTLDLQGPLIDRFQPTDPAQFASLPLDPAGLLARTLPLKAGQGNSMSNAAYDRAGALQLEDNPIRAGQAFDDAGVDVVAASQTTVYQAADSDSAQRLADALADARPGAQPAAAVPGLPQSRCVRVDEAGGVIHRHWCIATVDRYAFKTLAQQLDTAHQQMAAQYMILSG